MGPVNLWFLLTGNTLPSLLTPVNSSEHRAQITEDAGAVCACMGSALGGPKLTV